MSDFSSINPGLFDRKKRMFQSLMSQPQANKEHEGDLSAGPPRLDDLRLFAGHIDENNSDEEYVNEEYDQETNILLDDIVITSADADEEDDDKEQEKHTTTEAVIVPTKILAVVILLFLLITHSLLGRECVIASKSLISSIESGDLASRAITYWRAVPGQSLTIRSGYHLTSSVAAKFSKSEAENTEFEVYGKPYNSRGTKRLHIVSPVNGWATEKAIGGKLLMEPMPEKEMFLENYYSSELDEEEELGSLSNSLHTPFCPIFDAGYSLYKTPSRYHYAPTSLVVAQQFWNAAQVLYLFLLIALYGVMTSPSFSSSISVKRPSQLISDKTKRAILWVLFILFTTLTVLLLPFSVYFISPGGHTFACLMTTISLATVYFSPSNVRFDLVDLPPRWGTPRQHQSSLLLGNLNSSANTFTSTDTNDCIISGRRLCKVELIAFICNLGSSMYNYNTSRGHIFPNWNHIFHSIDKWLDLPGRYASVNYEVPGRFMYNMGIKTYHSPLFMPLSYGTATGSMVFLVLWSVLPFIYIFYFSSMYIMAKRAPGAKIQRFFALFGIFHFLFLTDVVSYKFGRGIRNEISEYCHWSERFAWRIAILLPIYQNIFSGHYKHPQRIKYVGIFLHYMMATWGIMFFVYQFLMNDCLHFPQWLMGRDRAYLFGWSYSMKLGYLGTLVVMVFVYGFMMLGGTWCHHVFVGSEENGNNGVKIRKIPAAVTLKNVGI